MKRISPSGIRYPARKCGGYSLRIVSIAERDLSVTAVTLA
jgi:hypothetical protein